MQAQLNAHDARRGDSLMPGAGTKKARSPEPSPNARQSSRWPSGRIPPVADQDKLEEELRTVDREVDETRAAYLEATRRRRKVFQRAAKSMSQSRIAAIIGKTQPAVAQVLKGGKD